MKKELMEKIVKILDEKKGEDITVIEITEQTIIADYFIIVTGTSNTHLKSLAGEIQEKLSKDGIKSRGIEGRATGWVLIDYNNIIVHLFLADSREHYNLERLWADAKKVDISHLLTI